jgi:DNA-binding NarL/FixJ family response regulator
MIRIFIIDDHQLFIDGLKALLGIVEQVEIVGSASSGEEGLKELEKIKDKVDVLITDYSMEGMSGYEVVKQVRERFPDIRILTLTMHDEIEYINKMINVGSLGYLMKNTGRAELIEAIETVNNGKSFYSKRVKDAILNQYTEKMVPKPKPKEKTEVEVHFTPRERQVLKLMVSGLPSKEIADVLCMSFHTVNTHRRNINSKIAAVSDLTVHQYAKKYDLLD